MTQADHSPKTAPLVVRLGGVAAALLTLGLLAAAPAQAAFEQVGCFAGSCAPVAEEKFPEEVQLGGVGGMAVNYTGAGGVEPGTVYAASYIDGGLHVAMFTPKPDGGLEFSLSWEVSAVKEASYERCGPALEPPTKCNPRVKAAGGYVDIDVDQSTGNVYVFNGKIINAGLTMITVFTPDGSKEITRFGEYLGGGKTTAESPSKIHDSNWPGGIAVNGAGEVYVFDINYSDNVYHRLMKFRPKVPGKYDEYEYAGAGEDVGAGFFGEGNFPKQPVSDAAGHLYVVSQWEADVEEYDPANPGDPPICHFEFKKGGITAITVDPETGTPFFFSYKNPKRLYELGPCDPETGQFKGGIIGESEVKPERDDLWALAFDPVRQFSPSRPPGVLYGGAPSPQPSGGVGKGEPGQSSLGYILSRPEENPPKVKSESFSHVTATSAELQALVDPKGFKTSYAFQYISEAAYLEDGESFAGAQEAPAGEAFLEGTGKAESVATTLTGLEPDTPYRYRAVARSHCAPSKPEKTCEEAGEVGSFHTFLLEATGLPDQRAYELVSPAQKNGGQVLPAEPQFSSCGSEAECKPGALGTEHFPMPSAPDGNGVVYEGTAFTPGVGAAIENQYIARRDPSTGWQSTNITPQLLNSRGGGGYKAFSETLDQAVLEQGSPSLGPEAPAEYENLYAQPTADPLSLQPLVAAQPPNRPADGGFLFNLLYAGASADLSRVFFTANDALTEETPFAPVPEDGGPTKFNLYEWERATGRLRLVNVLPGNATSKAGASFGVASANAISADGSVAFWSDEAGQLYVREDAELTRKIPDPGKFLSAAADGSKVLLSDGRLYDLEAEDLEAEGASVDLTGGKGGFKGIAGQSDDLSHVYFIDTEALTGEEENSEGAKAQAAKLNLYAWEGVGATRYVATLAAFDNEGSNITGSRTWSPFPFARTAQASPQGRYLAFSSLAPLTGYDSEGPCETDHHHGLVQAPCPEVFLYDSDTGKLSCSSCNPSGTSPLGWSMLRRIKAPGAVPSSMPQPRYLTDEGRLYFDSQDSLNLADTNEGVEDVYEYQPQGIGSCKRGDGCVSLISPGTGVSDSNFLAIDETGKNTFFTSRDQLVLKDKDELIDLYDAREGGGIAAETETQRAECQGEACQPAPIVPNGPDLGTAAVNGGGNVKSGPSKPRCPKARVRRKGRCIKPHKQSHRRHHRRATGQAGRAQR